MFPEREAVGSQLVLISIYFFLASQKPRAERPKGLRQCPEEEALTLAATPHARWVAQEKRQEGVSAAGPSHVLPVLPAS